MYNGSGLQYYRHSDWLGTNRFSATPSGTVYFDGAYAPYAENYAGIGTSDRVFTGQPMGTLPGLYDFTFREYGQAQGRWLVPDPAGLAAVDMTNPQTWNRYAYVMNNPLSYIDPLGLYLCVINGVEMDHGCPGTSGAPGAGGGGGYPIYVTGTCQSPYPNNDGGAVYQSCLVLAGYTNGFGSGPGGGGGNGAASNAPKQTKQQCIDNFLKTGYGPAGNFMAKTMVPSFSAISLFTNTWSWAKGEGTALLAKGALSAGPMAYGKLMTTIGTNLLQYPGQAAAASDALSSGAAWTTGGALAGEVLLFVGVEGSVFATTADAYARWTCRNVP